MKKITIVIITAVMMFGYGQTCLAGYKRGYKAIHVEGNVVTIQKKGSEPITVDEDKVK